jgi:hypothetical protein
VETIVRAVVRPRCDETVESALTMFEPMHAATGDENATHFRVHIKNVKLFKLVVGQVALGCSLSVPSDCSCREELSLGYLNGCNESSLSQFVRAAAACLQNISEPVKRTWAFSVAFDSSTIKATSYFDVRVRFAADAELHGILGKVVRFVYRGDVDWALNSIVFVSAYFHSFSLRI